MQQTLEYQRDEHHVHLISFVLRKEFPALLKLPSLWTRSYFASTAGTISQEETIQNYIDAQKGLK